MRVKQNCHPVTSINSNYIFFSVYIPTYTCKQLKCRVRNAYLYKTNDGCHICSRICSHLLIYSKGAGVHNNYLFAFCFTVLCFHI